MCAWLYPPFDHYNEQVEKNVTLVFISRHIAKKASLGWGVLCVKVKEH
jgi:hypothetical protein